VGRPGAHARTSLGALTSMGVTTAGLMQLIRRYAEVVAENRTYLIELDSAIGDADHGENLDRGFKAAVAKLDEGAPTSPSEVLKTVATTLISKVGGAAGPLYGTAFLRASSVVQGKAELEASDVVATLRAAQDGLVARGKAEPGDKTMVDAWGPALTAAEGALASGNDTVGVLAAAADAAEAGMRATIPLVARKGRASYLGERSAGHQDPGATSAALLFRTMADLAATCP
jgi:phosphoenolpyruvate---glycerone phosphotransferase subunit DhaL